MELGKDVEERVVEEKMKLQRANQCAAVVFSVNRISTIDYTILYASIYHKCEGV